MDELLTGLYVPLITPFTPDGQLATDALEGLAHHVLDAGAAGLVALGTTAEAATLSKPEQASVLGICASVCRERDAMLIAGAGSNDTRRSAQALADLARWPEVKAALTVVPYYSRPGEAGVVAHFSQLAQASPVPLVIYNIPFRTGQRLGWQAVRQLGSQPGIAGVKHSPGCIDDDTISLLAHRPPRFTVLAGDDAFASAMLALGASGAIAASANAFPAEFAALIKAWHAGDVGSARDLGHRVATLADALFAEPNPTVIKAVLHSRGQIPSPLVRLPLLPASESTLQSVLRIAETRPD